MGYLNAVLMRKMPSLSPRRKIEFESGKIDKGLWSQALVNAKGDEQIRKAEYMKLRVTQLKRQPRKTSTIIKTMAAQSLEDQSSQKTYSNVESSAILIVMGPSNKCLATIFPKASKA